MTAAEKKIITMLLKGYFLRQQKRGNKIVYVIYDSAINPISRVKPNVIKNIQRNVSPDIELWRYNKQRDITLNLSMVRRLHGNSTIKKLYKNRKELQVSGSIYSKKKFTKKNIQTNEKIYSLF